MQPLQPADEALFFHGGPDDPRLGHLVQPGPVTPGPRDAVAVALLGIADDRGVVQGGGRAGARLGPAEIRRFLYKLTPGADGELAGLRLFDLGDATPGQGLVPDDLRSVSEVHQQAEAAALQALQTGARVVLLGGGHDGAWASHSALVESLADRAAAVTAINVDAHLDVRPLRDGRITSGTPFRRLHERFGARYRVVEFGIQLQHNAAAHLEFARRLGWPVLELRRLREEGPPPHRFLRQLDHAAGQSAALAVSLDLDAVEAASAPGVSAPCPDGLSAGELCAIARLAGAQPAVRVLDVMECAPPLDESGRTARLGAAAVWSFLAGACERSR